MNKAPFAVLAAASLFVLASFADAPKFAAPFTSHAVLQRDCPLPVWGTADPGIAVTVALDDQTLSATADDSGAWRVTFPAQREPGLGHTLTLSADGAEAVVLDDIAIGDIWLCSGQSNMDMNYGWNLTRGKEDIEKSNDPMMRLFDDKNAVSAEPLAALTKPAEWTASDFAHSKTFSACGWFFSQALRKALPEVPIGLIEASWSGSPIKTWLSKEAYCSVGQAQADEYDGAMKAISEFSESGGKDEYNRRIKLWEAECKAKGGIHAETVGFDDSTWKTVSLPTTFEKHIAKDFDGRVWYRRAITLTAEQAAGEAKLTLGTIDDEDVSWINGVKVGSCDQYNQPRSYDVPAGTLREGENIIAIDTVDPKLDGGFTTDDPDLIALTLADGTTIPLAGEWRYEAFRFDPRPKDGDVSSWTPTACYNAMLHPLFPLALKGAIWYQGCSDVGRGGELYERTFRAMAADWRGHFTHPDGMPIYIVQLAAFRETHANPINSAWADMRWAHMRLGETLAKSGTAVTIDIGHHTDIHPKDKKTVGERLARLALARTYGIEGIVEAGPIPNTASTLSEAGGSVVVTFKNAAGLTTRDGGPLKGFQLVAADGKTVWAEAAIDGETVAVAVPEGMTPVKVRYAWDDYPVCNLVNGEDLPCGPFELGIGVVNTLPL